MSVMSALNEAFIREYFVELREVAPGLIQIWSLSSDCVGFDGEVEEIQPQLIATVHQVDGKIISIDLNFWRKPVKTLVGKLHSLLNDVIYEGPASEMYEIALDYRKVGRLVEIDVVTVTYNWWSYKKDGITYQSICGPHIEGPDIREVVAKLMYDPARDVLSLR